MGLFRKKGGIFINQFRKYHFQHKSVQQLAALISSLACNLSLHSLQNLIKIFLNLRNVQKCTIPANDTYCGGINSDEGFTEGGWTGSLLFSIEKFTF